MCTASWLVGPTGFELFFNRDESVRRGVARPPERIEVEGVRALAPLDPDAGGTWLGVNEHGLALGLLNAWDAHTPPAPRSRGLLVRDLLGKPTAEQALAHLAREPLERYRGFTLALFQAQSGVQARVWDGRALAPLEPRVPFSSSSFDHDRAQRERALALDRIRGRDGLTSELLARFHASHEPERGPFSPCMHRADASTVSACQVRVEARTVAMRYAPGPPCRTDFGAWTVLERIA